MLREGNGQPVVYMIDMSHENGEAIENIYRECVEAGKSKAFLAAFEQMYDRLRHEPRILGEPLYHLPVLRLQIRHAFIDRLVVYYGVHEDQPLVFIRNFKSLF